MRAILTQCRNTGDLLRRRPDMSILLRLLLRRGMGAPFLLQRNVSILRRMRRDMSALRRCSRN